jgi:hypothetical protein
MNRRFSALLVGFSLLTLTVLGFKLSEAEANPDALPRRGQDQDRVVRDVQIPDCPVRVRMIKTKKRNITMNRGFSDEGDWLQGLSLRAVNRSNKTVTYVGVRLLFRKTQDQTPSIPASFPFDYGLSPLWLEPGDPTPPPTIAPIAPGQEADIILSDAQHDELKDFLARTGFFPNHKRLELDITVVGFSDETMWNLGKWLKRDPTQLQKPLPGWRLLDDALREPPPPKEPKGSAPDRTAFFMLAGFRPRSPLTEFATKRSSPQDECGDYLQADIRCGNTGDTGIVCRYRTHEWSPSAYANFKVDIVFAPCKGTHNGVEFNCANPQPAYHAVLCSIPCGEQGETCVMPGDCCPGFFCDGGTCQPSGGGGGNCGPQFDGGGSNPCECDPYSPDCVSPILIDVAGNGFNLTDAAGGVDFDIRANGSPLRIGWTTANSDDAWLALDRNGNGTIENGVELFGNFTAQPASATPNGFIALAEYDKATNGGNGDRRINRQDAIFSSLRLWQDTNHNGVSESSELHRLRSLELAVIDLDYRETRRRDEHDNWFRYRARVRDTRDAQLGRWAWDVFLVSRP